MELEGVMRQQGDTIFIDLLNSVSVRVVSEFSIALTSSNQFICLLRIVQKIA